MTSLLPRLAQVFMAVALTMPALPVRAEDAFQSFKQLQSPPKMPKLNSFSPRLGSVHNANARMVALEAKLTPDGAPLKRGLRWRVFSPVADAEGKLPLVASSEGGSAELQLSPGSYFVNVSLGRAGVTKKLEVPEQGDVPRQVMVLDAGGLVLNAVSGTDTRIKPSTLKFKIYAGDAQEDSNRGLVMENIEPNTIVSLNTGTYHVVSEYGDVNAVVRADIKVEAGKLTEATLQHRAAQITFKLVADQGGEAIADTAWSILTASGDAVAESVSAYPVMVLSEGRYMAVARNKDNIYQKEFSVKAGVNTDVEVLLKDRQQAVQQNAGIDAN
ncbi:hypothetical protein [Rhizobium paknamense]|uniref:Carboxypeptidase regulatory-like domain-containing protein n=1 Tax=Rhizobium paknamense TaxID=1206817 RepID=A0ABU0IER2_9HYPH|nr:hypothetical protein [Rhizobium paknamense]MDQ0455945.1 hypothetical protein [Rhizobium paknamense]